MQKGHTHHIPICLNEGWKREHRQTLPTQMNNKIVLILEVGTADKDTKKTTTNKGKTFQIHRIDSMQLLIKPALEKTNPTQIMISYKESVLYCSVEVIQLNYKIKANCIIKTMDLNTFMDPL